MLQIAKIYILIINALEWNVDQSLVLAPRIIIDADR